ncbi:hypothetical protein AK88_05617 [Plasmodium fragile]|uniref:Schizont-infected cell agglutination C-terminal domain-containing protein n=1 Tax=Plasmodium fragile TaxID=5857 RepID=A0A0D9QGB8_PLAFR|nr:uncharacterized protein AK88_05617 [Plasmodium fragile]KJP84751.1 hypothetical protein AK88_05617 [Plasmodium fragile]
MNNDSEYHNATNCQNAYWEHPAEDGKTHQQPREMTRRTERVICRLMTQAIYFANAWSPEVRENAQEIDGRDKEIKGIMRCTIVDVYNDILRTYGCEGWWGTYYAWYTTGIIWHELGATLGENHCKRGMYQEIELGHWPMRQQMNTWLQQNPRMQKKLHDEKISHGCTGRKVKTRKQLQEEGVEQDQAAEQKRDDAMKHTVKQHADNILGEVQKDMEKEEKQLRASTDPAPTYPSGAEAHDQKAAAIENAMEQAIAHVKEELKKVIAETADARPAAAKAAAATPASTAVGTTPAGAQGPQNVPAQTDQNLAPPVGAPPAAEATDAGAPNAEPEPVSSSSSSAEAGGRTADRSPADNSQNDAVQTNPSSPSSMHENGAPGPSGSTGENEEAGKSSGDGSGPADGGVGRAQWQAPQIDFNLPKSGRNELHGHYGSAHTPSIKDITSATGTDDPNKRDDGIIPPIFTAKDIFLSSPVLIFFASVTSFILLFFLGKYFAHLAKRRRTYRTVRHVPSPPLDEEILDHLQRGERPPPDYGYTMVTDTQPGRLPAARRRSHPRVHTRTIIELHLEVLNECEATEWDRVKDDYWKIVVEEFAQDMIQDEATNNSILDVSISDQDPRGINVSSTDSKGTDPCPDGDPDPWNCMESIQLATDPCPPNEDDPDPWSCMETIRLPTHTSPPTEDKPDPWSCMETMQLDAQQSRAHSNHRDATSYCTQWINWIDRNKHLLQECTTQPWFLQLKADWTQFLRDHMMAHAASGEHRKAAFMDSKKHAWKQWIAQQHRQMSMYNAEERFQHLLHTVEDETVTATGDIHGVEKVMAAEHVLRVRDAPRMQLHPQPYMKQPLTAETWILILAFVIEESEVERSLQENELYVDDLLHQL